MRATKGKSVLHPIEVSRTIDYSQKPLRKKAFSGYNVKTTERQDANSLIASGLGHDIKNMLSSVNMAMTFLSRVHESGTREEQAKRSETLLNLGVSEVKKIQRLVQMLAGLQQGQQFLEVFDVNEVVHGAVMPFMYVSKKLDVTCNLCEDNLRIYGDRLGLSRAL